MTREPFDAVVVGAGAAGSIAALVLARGGARVALVDRATFARDKACGDIIGPRALALLSTLGLELPDGRRVSEIDVVGPTGRYILLPARAGHNYPGDIVELADGRCLAADVVIGADGANSAVAATSGLIETDAVLWGFAQRSYVAQHIDRPMIILWDDQPGHGFPGYGWLFPGANGTGNVGLGIGLRADRASASRVVTRFDAFCDHCRRLGLLSAPVDGRRLGGWLKMGMVGTLAARGRVLLVGDAAGLVNPLQGEGIAGAMTSAAAAAGFVLAGPGSAAIRYRQHLARGPGRYAAVAAPFHAGLISGSPRMTTLVGRIVTLPGIRAALASTWSLTWNDLLDGAPPGPTTTASKLALGIGRVATSRTHVRRQLNRVLIDH